MKLWKVAAEVDSRIEPILLSEKDMHANTFSLLGSEVKKNGIKIE